MRNELSWLSSWQKLILLILLLFPVALPLSAQSLNPDDTEAATQQMNITRALLREDTLLPTAIRIEQMLDLGMWEAASQQLQIPDSSVEMQLVAIRY